ncbi:hypothetical protein ABZP36_009755 [Zizania latifolia]
MSEMRLFDLQLMPFGANVIDMEAVTRTNAGTAGVFLPCHSMLLPPVYQPHSFVPSMAPFASNKGVWAPVGVGVNNAASKGKEIIKHGDAVAKAGSSRRQPKRIRRTKKLWQKKQQPPAALATKEETRAAVEEGGDIPELALLPDEWIY